MTSEMKKPCVADFKASAFALTQALQIGCKLFEDTANKNKKAKMQAYASATTADHFGVIVSGLKCFDPETSTFLKFPKKYGTIGEYFDEKTRICIDGVYTATRCSPILRRRSWYPYSP